MLRSSKVEFPWQPKPAPMLFDEVALRVCFFVVVFWRVLNYFWFQKREDEYRDMVYQIEHEYVVEFKKHSERANFFFFFFESRNLSIPPIGAKQRSQDDSQDGPVGYDAESSESAELDLSLGAGDYSPTSPHYDSPVEYRSLSD